MRHNVFTFFAIFISFNFIFGQSINPKKLDREISTLNDKHLYGKSILILQKIIDNPDASHYDRYNAYLQKYYTYKRVYDFSTALENIELAKKEGLLSNKKEECLSKIAMEDIFMKIEFQEFEKAKKALSLNQKDINLKLLDPDTKGFYFCTLAILEVIDKNYKKADENLDLAIEIFMKGNPRNLPNVFIKKMEVYKAIGNKKKLIEAYKKGLYYAKKYNVKVYEKNLYETMAQFYRESHNPKLVNYYLNLSAKTSIATYKSLNESEKLKRLEIKIKEDKEQQKEKYLIRISGIIFILLTILSVCFYYQYKKKMAIKQGKLKNVSAIQFTLQEKQTEENKLKLKEQELSDRQLQILELIKEGRTNKEIAAELYISENTVKYHLKIIYNTLEIKNRLQLKK